MVLFTLTGLNVDVGLYEFVEYPTYDFPDVSASYYLDLSFNPIYFDNIFYFKTTNPDLNSNVRIEQRTLTQLKDIAVTLGILDSNTVNDILTIRKYKTVIESLNNGTSRLLTADELNKYISTNGYITHLSDGIAVTETQLYSTTYSPLLPEIDEGTTEYTNVETRNQYAWQNIAINSNGAANNNPKKETQNFYTETSSSWNTLYTQDYGRNFIQVYYSENIFLGVSGEQNLPDMGFKCESSYWPDILYSEGVISNDSRSDINNYLPPPSANGVHYNKNIGVQWLARNITGGYNNSDLFANEEALVQQYVDLDTGYNFPMMTKSYQYFRIVIPQVNVESDPSFPNVQRAGITYIQTYDNNNILIDLKNISASSTLDDTASYQAQNITRIYPEDGYSAWISGSSTYANVTGNHIGSGTSITTISTINGEWVQWNHDNPTTLSKLIMRMGGFGGNTGYPPSKLVLLARNNESDNWDNIGTINSSFDFNEYTFDFYSTIKGLITNALDVSGGSDADPSY